MFGRVFSLSEHSIDLARNRSPGLREQSLSVISRHNFPILLRWRTCCLVRVDLRQRLCKVTIREVQTPLVERPEAHEDKTAWIATYVAITLSVSKMIFVMRSFGPLAEEALELESIRQARTQKEKREENKESIKVFLISVSACSPFAWPASTADNTCTALE